MNNWFSRWFKNDEQQSDEQLMVAFAQSGKRALLDMLLKRNGDDLYHYLLSQTDSATAADISQTTWLKVMEKREYYRDKGSFKSWLFTLGRNQLVDHLRQLNRWQSVDIEDNEQPSQFLEQTIAASEALDRFNALLAQLPFLQKEAFILQQEGFSLAQIAQITGEQQETIKSRIRYARNQFKSLYIQSQEEAS